MIVVDNNSSDHTAVVVESVAKQGLPVRRVVEPRIGYPFVYNRGILEAKKADWVCFIDDDCVANHEWYGQLVAGIARHPTAAAIMGASQTRHVHSLWSLATWSFDQMWKQAAILHLDNQVNDRKVGDLEVLDNKNIAYNQHFLKSHHIKFNEEALWLDGVGAAEDADLGMQISTYDGDAWFLPRAVVLHLDPTSFAWFCRKIIGSARAVSSYRTRWSTHRRSNSKQTLQVATLHKPSFRLWRQWLQTSKQYQLSGAKKISLLLIMIFGVCLFTLTYTLQRSKR